MQTTIVALRSRLS